MTILNPVALTSTELEAVVKEAVKGSISTQDAQERVVDLFPSIMILDLRVEENGTTQFKVRLKLDHRSAQHTFICER